MRREWVEPLTYPSDTSAATAAKILAYCLGDQFGREAIVDIRNIELPL